jgi:hypothetical protein
MARYYEPVAISSSADGNGHSRSDHYGVRARNGGLHHRVMARDLRLTWDSADRLCDILEDVRRDASAGETQRAETTQIGSVADEHATGEAGDAQGEPA